MPLRFSQFMLSKLQSIIDSKKIAIFCVVVSSFVFQIWLHPKILLEGRFFAEEGSIWWANSLNSSIIEQIFFVPPLTGYFCGVTNLVVLVSNFLPIQMIPLATSWISFIIQLQVCVVYWHYSSHIRSKQRILLLGIFLYSPIFFVSETFANSINSQTFLGLIAAIFLFYWQDPIGKYFKIYVYILLLLSFLSGWYGVILAPLYLVRLILGKKSNYKKSVVLSIFLCFVLQVAIYGYQKSHSLLWPEKDTLTFSFSLVISDAYSVLKSIPWIYPEDINLAKYLVLLLIFIVISFCIKNSWQNSRKNLPNYVYLTSAFVLEYFLILAGDASPAPGLHGRYLIILVGILVFGLTNLIVEYVTSKISFAILFFIFGVQLLMLGHGLNEYRLDPYVNCSDACLSWDENIAGVQNGSLHAYYFWPQNKGVPDWAISSRNPKIRLAPFQASIMQVPQERIPPLH